jgi:hypothetical protein
LAAGHGHVYSANSFRQKLERGNLAILNPQVFATTLVCSCEVCRLGRNPRSLTGPNDRFQIGVDERGRLSFFHVECDVPRDLTLLNGVKPPELCSHAVQTFDRTVVGQPHNFAGGRANRDTGFVRQSPAALIESRR